MTDSPLSLLERPYLIFRELARQPDADEGRRLYTDRQIGHDEALEAAQRLINSHFDNPGPQARTSVPAEPDRDDDLVLCAYLLQQRAFPSWLSYDFDSNTVTIDGIRYSRDIFQSFGYEKPGFYFQISGRGHGTVTITQFDAPGCDAQLLSALKAMVDRWEPDCDGQDRVMWENARDAITNAEGRLQSRGDRTAEPQSPPSPETGSR